MHTKLISIFFGIFAIILIGSLSLKKTDDLPVVAIANYGPHASLEASILGIKETLKEAGFIENKTIRYEIKEVGFDASLIPQMITQLKNQSPQAMIVMTTPVAQFAKGSVKGIPLIYDVVTDPVAAGLLKQFDFSDQNMTGSSDRQDLKLMLEFVKKLIPNARRIGLLYATAEANDIALVKMMNQAAESFNMEVVAIPVDQTRDVPLRMQHFKDKVDVIYVGTSGPIQPTLPVIAAEANKMNIPVINVDSDAVKTGLVLASFGVDYKKVGNNAGKLLIQVLKGVDLAALQPLYPTIQDHHGFVNLKRAQALGISIPKDLANLDIVE